MKQNQTKKQSDIAWLFYCTQEKRTEHRESKKSPILPPPPTPVFINNVVDVHLKIF